MAGGLEFEAQSCRSHSLRHSSRLISAVLYGKWVLVVYCVEMVGEGHWAEV